MTGYWVYKYEPYENETCVLENASLDELKQYLLNYRGFIDELTVIEGKEADLYALFDGLGIPRRGGRAGS